MNNRPNPTHSNGDSVLLGMAIATAIRWGLGIGSVSTVNLSWDYFGISNEAGRMLPVIGCT